MVRAPSAFVKGLHETPAAKAPEPLETRLLRTERLHLRAAGQLASHVGEKLTELHRRDAIHGELSPRNVIVEASEADAVSITVLGLSHVAAPRGARAFPDPEPGYASPESLLGLPVDSRVDCWAFAVLLYRCTYGRLPFRARNADELLASFSRPVIVPDAFGPETDPLLGGFFARCFARRSASRLSVARTMGETFAALVLEAARISEDPFSFRQQTPGAQIVPISAGRGPRF